MDWDDIRYFAAVARAGSMRAAAEALGVNHATVSRRLAALERSQHAALFERGGAKLQLTALGEALLAQARRMEREAQSAALILAAGDQRVAGRLRVSVGDALVGLLMPALAAFRQQYPEVSLDIDVSNERASLQRREADVALRLTDTPPEPLVGRRIGQLLVARYAHRCWEAESPERVPRIDWSESWQHLPRREGAAEADCRVNTAQAMAQAVQAGLGAAELLCVQGDGLADVCRLSEPRVAPHTQLWLLTHPQLRRQLKVRYLMEALTAELRESPFVH